jgi:uncharacterized iron-regulated protein
MRRIMVVVLGGAVLGGCAARPAVEVEAVEEVAARSALVLDGEGGERVAWASLVNKAAAADVVVIGEMHGHEKGLSVAAALWEDVVSQAQGAGRDPALCMEFFERDEQAALDDYLTGVTDEEAFRKATGRTDGNYPAGHRAMIETAKAAGVRVYAANAPRRYATVARTDGFEKLEGLRGSQQRLFVVPQKMPEGEYKDRFFEQMGGMLSTHGGEGAEEMDEEAKQAKLEGYFRAQSMWDATMADTICTALAAGRGPVVQVVGQFHSDREGGVVARVRERRPEAKIVTVSMSASEGEVLVDDDKGRATYVVPVGPGED